MKWLFNNYKFYITGDFKETIVWKQKRNFNGNKGDLIVFFEFNFLSQNFTYLYRIASVNKKRLDEIIDDQLMYEISAELELEQSFGNEKEIVDYIYSFPRIIYFDKYLYRHFNRRYYRLSNEEFNAITEDEIFEARSIIGTALNSLHIDHRKAFIQHAVNVYPEIIQNNYNHFALLELFYEYFQFSIIGPSKQLIETYENLRNISNMDQPNFIGFGDNDEVENIYRQVQVINEYLGAFENIISVNESQSRVERRFENIFRWRGLPIDLNE